MPPCWSRRIVAQYLCGHRARRIMRTYHAVSQGRNWTRYEQPNAANTAGTFIEASHSAAPPAEAQADGAAERSRRVHLCPVRRFARAATAVLGANLPRAKPGDVVSMHAELGGRGARPRRYSRGSKRRPPPRSPNTTSRVSVRLRSHTCG